MSACCSRGSADPQSLAPIQRLPHVDGLEPDRLAILVYLSGAETGGTAFYRQRATGYETVDAARFDARPNRALIYRSHLLHCARIASGAALPADPATGRLTINAFLFDPR